MSALGHTRFSPNSNRKSGFSQKGESALHLKADMCTALARVCYGPKSRHSSHSITSSAVNRSFDGMLKPCILAVRKLITNSYLVGCWMGRLAGFSPRKIRFT